jgi:hypothetical protein
MADASAAGGAGNHPKKWPSLLGGATALSHGPPTGKVATLEPIVAFPSSSGGVWLWGRWSSDALQASSECRTLFSAADKPN